MIGKAVSPLLPSRIAIRLLSRNSLAEISIIFSLILGIAIFAMLGALAGFFEAQNLELRILSGCFSLAIPAYLLSTLWALRRASLPQGFQASLLPIRSFQCVLIAFCLVELPFHRDFQMFGVMVSIFEVWAGIFTATFLAIAVLLRIRIGLSTFASSLSYIAIGERFFFAPCD